MNLRSILLWGALAVTLTAATTQAQSLRVVDENGKPAAECPLKHTAVKAEVSGFMSRVTVTQNFENPFAEKIEAVYTFPLPQMAAVDDLTMQIGERTIKGKIMRREQAAQAYAEAKKMGKIASLLDQERPNVFSQQVANILPGQQIRVTISYVETLKYEDGSYEWTFPMVVDERYRPAISSDNDDSPNVSPARLPSGMRSGQNVSLEINVDAGVPIVSLNSTSHEIDVQQLDYKRAIVRLKDHAAIPNKDFLLTYGVAGDTIKDAVLAHRSDRGGFFTLILQPPQRVQAEGVMPKEMVFVLDTSGSMIGPPLETAKKTMELALNTLYPHDTFNLITFSGDTQILFPEPVPATAENLRRAKEFLSSRESAGGTEMMKAIQAALDPSDSQHHVRIACFMTDGQVGNDREIIQEVYKHKNARVFAMGFGPAPNRALLDKMTQYGRGEVDYVAQPDKSSAVANRFNSRIRNPLLTDISIEWSNLSVTEIYPKYIPDLFGAKPLIVSGRYTTGGKGKILLRGKMAGQDFVREIPVELPEVEQDHDSLASLWARQKIDDLTATAIELTGDQSVFDQRREEITQLGLTFKLMTRYTSFVAIDDAIYTGDDDPLRIEVKGETIDPSMTTVAISHGGCSFILSSPSATQTVTSGTIQNLPIQGRSFAELLTLTPGTSVQGNISMRGQSTNLTLDGVNMNYGIAPGGESPGASASGNTPALTASGGANGIVTVDAVNEVRVQTASAQAEGGRVPGPQVAATTRSGSNTFHGSLFHFFGNDALDANDWFANSRGLEKPPRRLNLFGGTLAGPVVQDKTFFFGSYEGLRLRQPLTGITDVPSLSARQAAPDEIRPFLEAFPRPTGAARPDGFAEFTATFANPARHDAGSIRIDHLVNQYVTANARYSFADSEASQRGANGFSLNTTNRIRTRTQSLSGSWTQTFGPNVVFEFDANYSRARVNAAYLLDEFGGATVPVFDNLQSRSFAFDLNSRNAAFIFGDDASNTQRQINLTASTTWISGKHTMNFGGDYRRLSPIIGMRATEQNVLFDGVAPAVAVDAARVNNLIHSGPQSPVFNIFSLYAQDEWRKSTRLTLTFGMRWELGIAPSDDLTQAVDQVHDPATLQLRAPGTQLWNTTFGNFAPLGGFSYQLMDPNNAELVLQGGASIHYDRGQDRSGDVFANSIPFISGSSIINSPFTSTEGLPLLAFDPHLKLPYTINWNVMIQKSLGSSQSVSAAYIGSSGKRLLHTETLFDRNPDFPFLRLTTNRSRSNHHAMQFTFERFHRNGLAALVSYTWSKSRDNVVNDSDRRIIVMNSDPELDYGPSDFDIRHQVNGFVTYEIPAPFVAGLGNTLFRNWSADSIVNARSAKPFNFFFMFPTSIGAAYFRPDGARRNDIRGFPLYQVDLALRRRFHFTDAVDLQFQADAFNLFNHVNFEDPIGNDLVLGTVFRSNSAFAQSTSLSGRSLSNGFSSFYGPGGPRTLRFSLKLAF